MPGEQRVNVVVMISLLELLNSALVWLEHLSDGAVIIYTLPTTTITPQQWQADRQTGGCTSKSGADLLTHVMPRHSAPDGNVDSTECIM